jgi:bacillithiol biosynthesis deacetylase BshB2
MHRHVLVVLAHPDDETFGCGGTIALHSRAGTPVTYVCATRGEMGRNMGKPPFANRETLGALREKELREACKALGITDLRFLGIWDRMVEFVDPNVLSARIGEIIAEVQPSLIITFYPGYAVHPDHNAIGAATIRAVAALAPERRPEVHCHAFGSRVGELGEPQVVDITSVREVKLAAIKAHRSQSEVMLARAEKEPAMRQRREEWLTRERFWVYHFE